MLRLSDVFLITSPRKAALLSQLCRWGNWSLEGLHDLLKVTHLSNGRRGVQTQAVGSRFDHLTANCTTIESKQTGRVVTTTAPPCRLTDKDRWQPLSREGLLWALLLSLVSIRTFKLQKNVKAFIGVYWRTWLEARSQQTEKHASQNDSLPFVLYIWN